MMSARIAEFWGPSIIFFSLTHATDFAVKEGLLALYTQQKLSVSSNEEATVGMVKRMVCFHYKLQINVRKSIRPP